MKKKVSLILIICSLWLTPLNAQVRGVAPWFRGGATAWQSLTYRALTPERLAREQLSHTLLLTPTRLHVKTNIPNWIQFRTAHTGALNSMEKRKLTVSPNYVLGTSGKLAYFYDRDLLLLSALREFFPEEPYNAQAFALHQDILETTRNEIEIFALEELVTKLHGWMSTHEAEILLKDQTQPLCSVLVRSEVKTFATLTTLEQQRQFAKQQLADIQDELVMLLKMPEVQLTNGHFAQYYYSKMRAEYFQILVDALENATAPLPSIVVRVAVPIQLNFLPNPTEVLTDAQRLGKLYFYSHQNQFSTAENIQLQAKLNRQSDVFKTYATAEAFQVPYEQLLDLYTHGLTPQDIFGPEGGKIVQELPKEELKRRIPQTLEKIKLAQQQLREQNPNPTPEVYVEYFRLVYKYLYYSYRL